MKSRFVAFAEALAVCVVAYAIRALLRGWGAGFAAGAVSTIVALLLSTWLLHRGGSRWSDLGLRRPATLRSAALWTLALWLASMLLAPVIVTVISNAAHLPAQHLEVFSNLRGNLALYLILLIPIAWGTAGFGEELLFRGFLMRRLADAFGGGRAATVGAVLVQAVLFGFAHAYLGPRGMLNAGALGLFAGICYLLNGRNLWPLFIAHSLVDTVGITVLFLGLSHA